MLAGAGAHGAGAGDMPMLLALILDAFAAVVEPFPATMGADVFTVAPPPGAAAAELGFGATVVGAIVLDVAAGAAVAAVAPDGAAGTAGAAGAAVVAAVVAVVALVVLEVFVTLAVELAVVFEELGEALRLVTLLSAGQGDAAELAVEDAGCSRKPRLDSLWIAALNFGIAIAMTTHRG